MKMWRLYYFVGWLRFRGWHNVYWREDTIKAWLCDHEEWFQTGDPDGQEICVGCGQTRYRT